MNVSLYEISTYLWPLLTLFQVVVSVIAVLKVKGTGPVLMLVGTIGTLLRTLLSYLPLDMSFDNGPSDSLWVLMGLGFLGRFLFLIGLLIMVQQAVKPRKTTTI